MILGYYSRWLENRKANPSMIRKVEANLKRYSLSVKVFSVLFLIFAISMMICAFLVSSSVLFYYAFMVMLAIMLLCYLGFALSYKASELKSSSQEEVFDDGSLDQLWILLSKGGLRTTKQLTLLKDEVEKELNKGLRRREIVTERAFQATITGCVSSALGSLFGIATSDTSFLIALLLILATLSILISAFSGPIWDIRNTVETMPVSRLRQFYAELSLLLLKREGMHERLA